MENKRYAAPLRALICHHPTIKFTAIWSAEQVMFLDTTIYLKDGQSGTDLYT